MFKIQNF